MPGSNRGIPTDVSSSGSISRLRRDDSPAPRLSQKSEDDRPVVAKIKSNKSSSKDTKVKEEDASRRDSSRTREGRKEKKEKAEKTDRVAPKKLRNAPKGQQSELFRAKVQGCKEVFDFKVDPNSRLKEKEQKQAHLLEIIDCFGNLRCEVDAAMISEVMDMISVNIFRVLTIQERTPLEDIADPEDTSVFMDPSWSHLSLVYDVFQRFIDDTKPSMLVRHIDKGFLLKLMELFSSDDARERSALNTIVSRIFNKFEAEEKQVQGYIRMALRSELMRASYGGETQNGIGELLELAAESSQGFTLELGDAPKEFFTKLLLPLHKQQVIRDFHPQLMRCIRAHAEMDARLTYDIVSSLLQVWPESASWKQVLFLDELETVLQLTPRIQFRRMRDQLVQRVALCIKSPHYQVAERALSMYGNPTISKLLNENPMTVFPIIMGALQSNANLHWHPSVKTKTDNMLKVLHEKAPVVFEESLTKRKQELKNEEEQDALRQQRWAKLEQMFHSRALRTTARARARQDRLAGRVSTTTGVSPVSPSSTGAVHDLRKMTMMTTMATVGEDACPPVSGKAQPRAPMKEGALRAGRVGGRLLHRSRYGFALTFDSVVEVDLQALIVDGEGNIIDAVHSQNEIAASRAIMRVKDRVNVAMPDGCRGMLSVTFDRLPQRAEILVFCVAAYTWGHLKDVTDGMMHLIDSHGTQEDCFPFHCGNDVCPLAVVRRVGKSWEVVHVEGACTSGRHFTDVFEPLGNLIRDLVPAVPKERKLTMQLRCGSIVDLPEPASIKCLFLGVCWDLSPAAIVEDFKLEVVALLFNRQGLSIATVGADTPGHGMHHSGSGLLSAGFNVDMDAVPRDVLQIVVLGNISAGDLTLIQAPSCQVVDFGGTELVRFVHRGGDQPGLLVARLFRNYGRRRWTFQAVGKFCRGHEWRESVEDATALFHTSPDVLQQAQRLEYTKIISL